jgi:Regulatory subunit of type II PKA R-subunit
MASTYLQKFPVPEQFPEILHDLLREILREQPEDIIEFSYRYFKDKQEVGELNSGCK